MVSTVESGSDFCKVEISCFTLIAVVTALKGRCQIRGAGAVPCRVTSDGEQTLLPASRQQPMFLCLPRRFPSCAHSLLAGFDADFESAARVFRHCSWPVRCPAAQDMCAHRTAMCVSKFGYGLDGEKFVAQGRWTRILRSILVVCTAENPGGSFLGPVHRCRARSSRPKGHGAHNQAHLSA